MLELLVDVRVDAIQDLLLRHGADQLVDRFAILVHDHGWDVEHTQLTGVLLVLVDVDLGDLHARVLLGDFLKHRANHLAWATPWSPEINEYRLIGLDYFVLKSGVGNFYSCHRILHCPHRLMRLANTFSMIAAYATVVKSHPASLLPTILVGDMEHRKHHATKPHVNIAFDASFLSLPASGIGTYVRGLTEALLRRQDELGISVRLIEPQPGRILQPGHKLHRFLWDATGVTPATLRQAGRPDVIHLPQMSAPVLAPAPMVLTIHDVIPLVLDDYRASRAMQAYLSLMARTSKRARLVIAPSHAAADDIARVLGIDADRITVIPEAPDQSLAPDVSGAARARVAEEWGVTGPYLFNIGGYDRRKNLPLTIEAFAAALPQLPADAKLVIGGAPHSDNPHIFPPLEPVIREHGLHDHVVLTGRVSDEDRRALYQAATGYVTASEYEGFGLTPLESMACGVPAIVANRTSLPEVVGDAGLIVEPTVDELAKAMVKLFTDAVLHGELSRLSLERAGTFTWDAAAKQTVEVYHRASRM